MRKPGRAAASIHRAPRRDRRCRHRRRFQTCAQSNRCRVTGSVLRQRGQHPVRVGGSRVHVIVRVRGVPRGAACVRTLLQDGIGSRVVEEDLCHEVIKLSGTRVSPHTHVDVNGPAGVPARVNYGATDLPAVVRNLIPAQKSLSPGDHRSGAATGIVSGLIRINSHGIAVPDIHQRTRQRHTPPTAQILQRNTEGERNARPRHAGVRIRADIRTEQFFIHPVRALRELRHGRHATRRLRRTDGRVLPVITTAAPAPPRTARALRQSSALRKQDQPASFAPRRSWRGSARATRPAGSATRPPGPARSTHPSGRSTRTRPFRL